MEKLSIIVPSYNDYLELELTLKSIAAYKELVQLICVDSSDNNTRVKTILFKNFSDATYLYSPPRGVYFAINEGIKLVNMKYMMVLNAGDELISDLPHIINIVSSRKGEVVVFNQEGSINGNSIIKFTPNFKTVTPHQSVIYDSQLHLNYGLYDTQNAIVSDQKFFQKLKQNGVQFNYENITLSRYDLSGMSSKMNFQVFKNTIELYKGNAHKVLFITKWILKYSFIKIFGYFNYYILLSYIKKTINRLKNEVLD